jgi:hypothetical protein
VAGSRFQVAIYPELNPLKKYPTFLFTSQRQPYIILKKGGKMRKILGILVVLLIFMAGCASVRTQNISGPELHPGHPGHEVH